MLTALILLMSLLGSIMYIDLSVESYLTKKTAFITKNKIDDARYIIGSFTCILWSMLFYLLH